MINKIYMIYPIFQIPEAIIAFPPPKADCFFPFIQKGKKARKNRVIRAIRAKKGLYQKRPSKMSSSISVKPGKSLAEDTVNSSKTVSIKESAPNSREAVLFEVPDVTRLAFLGERKKSETRETQGYWGAEIL